MTEKWSKTTTAEPLAKKGKRPPRSKRIQRRKMLALQRREEKMQAVTLGN